MRSLGQLRMTGAFTDLGKAQDILQETYETQGIEAMAKAAEQMGAFVDSLQQAISPLSELQKALSALATSYVAQLDYARQIGVSLDLVTEAFDASVTRMLDALAVKPLEDTTISLDKLVAAIETMRQVAEATTYTLEDIAQLELKVSGQ